MIAEPFLNKRKSTGGPWLARILGQRKTRASQIRAAEVMKIYPTPTLSQWHSRLQTLPKMISPLFRQTQKSLGCLEIRNLIRKMKILDLCAKILLELNNLQKTARKQCFLAVF